MKLPNIKFDYAMKDLTLEDSAAPVNIERGQAQLLQGQANNKQRWAGAAGANANASRAWGALYENAADLVNEQVHMKFQRDSVKMTSTAINQIEMSKNYLNRKSIPIDEIPLGMDYRKTDAVLQPDGTVKDVERTQINPAEIAEQYQNQQLKGIHTMADKELLGDYKLNFQQNIQGRELAFKGFTNNMIAKNNYETLKDDTILSAKNLFERGYTKAGHEVLNNADVLTTGERSDLLMKFTRDGTRKTVTTALLEGTQAELQIAANEVKTSVLPDNEKLSSLRSLKQQSEFLDSDHQQQLAMSRDRLSSDLEIAVYQGNPEVNYATIDKAFNNQTITGAKRTQLYKMMQEGHTSRVNQNQRLSLVSTAIDNDVPMDVKNKEHVKAVNQYYEQIKDQPERVIRMVQKTTLLPTALEGSLSMGAKGNPQQMAEAAGFYSGLRSTVPAVTSQVDSVTSERLSTMSYLTKHGVSAEDAKQMIEDEQALSPEDKDTNQAVYKKNVAGDSVEELLDNDIFDPDWSNDPNMDSMVPAYDNLRWRYYSMTGSYSAAKQMAQADLATVWSKSDINATARESMDMDGSELMFMPPERYYNIDIEQDLSLWAEDVGLKRDEILLVSDLQTSKEKNKSWKVMKVVDGLPEHTRNRYTPNTSRAQASTLDNMRGQFRNPADYDVNEIETAEPFPTKGTR